MADLSGRVQDHKATGGRLGHAVRLLLGRATTDHATCLARTDAVPSPRADEETKGHHIVIVQVETGR